MNFSVGRPFDRWVEKLKQGGRLVFPLGAPTKPERRGGPRFAKSGAAFAVERRENGLAASWICPAHFVWAEGTSPDASDEALSRLHVAFRSGAGDFVKNLIWGRTADPGRCWFWTADWALSYDEPGGDG